MLQNAKEQKRQDSGVQDVCFHKSTTNQECRLCSCHFMWIMAADYIVERTKRQRLGWVPMLSFWNTSTKLVHPLHEQEK